MIFERYDIIVVGGGHAGCEAAAAAARLGSRVLLITMNIASIAQMSCNPAMGGIAKGQIVREIDALGGLSGIVTDHTMIQFRMLNKSKGPAMWSPRAQSDRVQFSLKWQELLSTLPNLHVWQDSVTSILVEDKMVKGVDAAFAGNIFSKAVIITSGTFLNGLIHIGRSQFKGGRLGEANASDLTESLQGHGIQNERLKTGTPVRVDGRSIDFSRMTEQKGDAVPGKFSFTDTPTLTDQRSCYLTYTNKKAHDILAEGFEDSPLFAGRIQGSGPRYCPSIEDKLERFAERDRHQLFIEPEGRSTDEYYVNGFSSSLPIEIQYRALLEVPGFENARILKPGYAIEYDFFPPTQLNLSLESRIIRQLYFAGQVNGTTGYEEAAGQGLMAGINAHRRLKEEDPLVLKRHEAYIGVLIDDLVTKGTQEPYRMFTSRAEFRTLLRQDNADQRLTRIGHSVGLAGRARVERLARKETLIHSFIKFLHGQSATPENVNDFLERSGTSPLQHKTKYMNLVLRPQISLKEMIDNDPLLDNFFDEFRSEDTYYEAVESAEILIKYKGYIEKEREIAEKITRLEDISLTEDFNYLGLQSISKEAREKLQKTKPANIGQAARISGITPSDISVLLVYLGR